MSTSTPPPSVFWKIWQTLKGMNNTLLTSHDVPETDLTGKWIIITGANNGIGFEAAKTFAKWGANLILACREPPEWETHPSIAEKECKALAESAGHASIIEWWKLDMTDLSTIDEFAQRWLDMNRVLDVLCNNAGIATTPGVDTVYTKDGFELTHQINFLSHVYLTFRLLPSLAQSPEPRIVCTTSCHHFLSTFDLEHFNGDPGMRGEAYGNNKLYYQIWITEFHKRLLGCEKLKHITINGVNPGYVNSGIWNNLRPDIAQSFVETYRTEFFKFLARRFAITPQQGSMAIVNAATSPMFGPDPGLQGVGIPGGTGGGHYVNRIWAAESMPYCADENARREVWEKVEEELHLGDKGLHDTRYPKHRESQASKPHRQRVLGTDYCLTRVLSDVEQPKEDENMYPADTLSTPRQVLFVGTLCTSMIFNQAGLGNTLTTVGVIGDSFGITNPANYPG
ncbi:hypothetical protein AK830_g2109 [Neonectria ditissima]|uniref:WW domain-containing oxidoreductase n=1 Tax=Neonectria ditissima TaxID=78410 RepID=A0A0P7BX26_9HYPO|nr:hypothetical protein AK830_g2109 [Neonectria ditissima]